MDSIIFGDNQFFGVNHMSEEKARQQAMQFQKDEAILAVLRSAYEAGIRTFMCTTHDRIADVADVIRRNPGEWEGFKFFPCMPYAHKYANAVTEHGYVDALRKFLPADGALNAILRGSKAVLTQDMKAVISLLVDAEMKMFDGLQTPAIFLQNVVTDLVIGLRSTEALRHFADHVRKRYGAEPGFITMNVPMLLPMLAEAGIERPLICANVNKLGFRMSGGIDAYREVTEKYGPRMIAMSVFASGAIEPREAIQWVLDEPYVQSIVFGASSRRNIDSTVSLINGHSSPASRSEATAA